MDDPVKIAAIVVPALALLLQFLQWALPQPGGDASPFKKVSRSRKWVVAITFIVIVASLGYYSIRNVFPSELSASPVDRIRAKGNLVVGVMYNSPPFGNRPSSTDTVRGFEADIGREVAREIFKDPNKISFVETVSEKRFSRDHLEKNGIDIVISTVSVNYDTDNRRETMDFSDPYYISGQRILARKDLLINHSSELEGKVVCVGKGENEANLRNAIPGVIAQPVGSTASCLSKLMNGEIDAISSDEYIVLRMLRGHEDELELKAEPLTTDSYGIAVRKEMDGYVDLLNFLNTVLSNLRRDGRWEHIYQTHIAPLSPDDPAMHSCG